MESSEVLISFLVIVFIITVSVIHYKRVQFVKANSSCYKAIQAYNQTQQFKDFNTSIHYNKYCNTKRQLDNFNIDSYMLAIIDERYNNFSNLVQSVQYNKQKYIEYEREFDRLLDGCKYDYEKITCNSPIITAKDFRRIECEECKIIKKKCLKDFKITVVASYTSPQGRNSYSRTFTLNCANVEYYINQYNNAQKHKQTAQYQRTLMTDKLRYKIMKRDGFKCAICGASQRDGAKLHVDHILPVSKGGKTTESNLRTLCDRCNLGKGASYDPYGIN